MTIVEINEKSKAGKALLEFLENYSAKGKGVNIIKTIKKEGKEDYPISKNIPNTETLKIFKENDRTNKKTLKNYENVEELFEDLDV